MNSFIGLHRHIVFDWNGTVIDDVQLALLCVNNLRVDFGFQPITIDEYRAMFRFPIRDFYQDIGFDFDKTPFEALMKTYLSYFDVAIENCELCPGFLHLASLIRRNGRELSVLSASHQDILTAKAKQHQIDNLLHCLFGLKNNSAYGKLERAQELDKFLVRNPGERVLMIGDTDHDHEVAVACGWDFIAVASGHQSRVRLERLGTPVVDHLNEIAAHLHFRPDHQA